MTQIRVALVGVDALSKATVARYLEKQYDYSLFPLFDGIRRVYYIMYGRTGRYKRTAAATKIASYDALYKIDKDIWLSYLDTRLAYSTRPIVIQDPRYVYEVEQLVNRGFIVVRVIPEKRRAKISNIKDAAPNTVLLAEFFPHHTTGYKPSFQVNIYKDKETTHLGLDKLAANLKVAFDTVYNDTNPTQIEGGTNEEAISTSDAPDDRGSE